MTKDELIDMLRAEMGWHDGKRVTGKMLAEKYGVSEQYMNNVLSNRRGIGDKLADGMGFNMVVTFEKKQNT